MTVRDPWPFPINASDSSSPIPPATSFRLLGHRSMQALFAWRAGRSITVEQYLADARHLATLLPAQSHLINGCSDAYQFVVGLLAAMLRGQVSVLPHNPAPQTLRDLACEYAGAPMLIDTDSDAPPIAYLRCPADHAPLSATGATCGTGCSEQPDTSSDGLAAVPTFDADRLVAILFTSGSTGRAQALPRRWGTIALSAQAEAQRLGLTPEQPCAVLATGPAQHSYGFESAIWLPMLAGGQIVAEHPFYPADVFAQLAALPMPRMLVTSPVHLRASLGSSLSAPPASIVMSATAPLPLDLAHAAESQFGATLIEIYGSTETGQVASRRTTETDVWQTLPGVRFEQRGATSWARDGHVGEPTALSDRIELIDAEHFRLLGRHADLIKVAGKRGSLRDVEQQLLAIDGVDDAAVLASDDSRDMSARLTGFVVAPSLGAAQIVQRLRDRLDPAFIPRPLIFVAKLPRDGNGKLPRSRLLEMATQHAGRRAGSAASTSGETAASTARGTVAEVTATTATPPALRSRPLMTPSAGPMFDGHFPGLPILPGARLLDLIATAIGLSDGFEAANVKFVEPVGPAAPLTLSWQTDASGRIAFDCRTLDARRIAHGTLRPL